MKQEMLRIKRDKKINHVCHRPLNRSVFKNHNARKVGISLETSLNLIW